nr:hypothetical protein [Tanacetum cinerariifolium]
DAECHRVGRHGPRLRSQRCLAPGRARAGRPRRGPGRRGRHSGPPISGAARGARHHHRRPLGRPPRRPACRRCRQAAGRAAPPA